MTGGAGFIGSHLVDELVRDGCEVVVFDNLSSGRVENIGQRLGSASLRFVEGDVRHSYADVSEARKALGHEPRIFLKEGLATLVACDQNINTAVSKNA